jgi:hypothetical protein
MNAASVKGKPNNDLPEKNIEGREHPRIGSRTWFHGTSAGLPCRFPGRSSDLKRMGLKISGHTEIPATPGGATAMAASRLWLLNQTLVRRVVRQVHSLRYDIAKVLAVEFRIICAVISDLCSSHWHSPQKASSSKFRLIRFANRHVLVLHGKMRRLPRCLRRPIPDGISSTLLPFS